MTTKGRIKDLQDKVDQIVKEENEIAKAQSFQTPGKKFIPISEEDYKRALNI